MFSASFNSERARVSTKRPNSVGSNPRARLNKATPSCVSSAWRLRDKVDWFSGAAAEQACAEDAVPQDAHLDGWCSVYYYRNVNPMLRDVSVSPDAVITTLQGTTPVSDDLQTLADRAGSSGGDYHLYRSVVTDGAIVEITQIYQP